MLSLSPSKINIYKQCPFKYQCESDLQTRNAYKTEGPDLVFGNLIHACLNDLYKRTEKKQRNLKTLRKLFETKFKVNWDKHKDIFGSREKIIKYIKEAQNQFQNFIGSEFFNKEPIVTEEFPKFKLNDDLELGGKFDRVDLVNNELVLIDYKTGKFREDKNNIFQLDFYEFLLTKTRPKTKVKEKILYYLKDNKILRFKPAQNINSVENEILKIADIIDKDKSFDPTPNNMCKYCDYRVICPEIKY